MLHCVGTGGAHQPLGSLARYGLYAEPGSLRETHLVDSHFVMEELPELLGLRRTRFPFDSGIYVFGIFPENDHIHLLRVLYRRDYTLEPTHRALAHIKVKSLTQSYVE